MFYSHDLLCRRRNGRFAAIWLLAHAPPRSRPCSVSSKDVAAIDIPRACADILVPPAPMSLRFASTLLLGLAQALSRHAALLRADAQAARSRIVSTPWIATSHTLPPGEAVASAHAITLPDALVPEYPNWHASSEHWIIMSGARQLLGWPAKEDVHALSGGELSAMAPSSSPLRATSAYSSAASYTAAWEDISIPDADVRRALPLASSNNSPGMLLPFSSSPAQRLPPAVPADDDFMRLADDGEEPSFHFDVEGNLQFAPPVDPDCSHDLSLGADSHTQLLGQFTASHLALPAPPEHSNSVARDELALVTAENDVLFHVGDRPAKRQRLARKQVSRLAATGTFVSRVPELWANTCYWHAESQAVLDARARKSTRHFIARQLQVATAMYSVPDICGVAYLLGPPLPQNPDSVSPAPESDNAQFADYSDDDDVLELELGRGGGSPATTAQLSGDEHYPDMHLDIPWLNPDIFGPARRPRQSMGQTLSIRTESNPEPGRQHPHSVSSVGTPASRAPSLDPPLSDEGGIEIQSFHLAAHNLGEPEPIRSPQSEHGLDSFLDVSRFGLSAADARQLDKDSGSFRQFALTRMADQDADMLVFDDLLQHPYRNRRVAARAFADLLQMATKSVFAVTQREPFATISIAKL
ncbi:R8 protein [Coemansia sp. RSA 1836]|nr:R8 protein [Coemansia sp. RSA 1836]